MTNVANKSVFIVIQQLIESAEAEGTQKEILGNQMNDLVFQLQVRGHVNLAVMVDDIITVMFDEPDDSDLFNTGTRLRNFGQHIRGHTVRELTYIYDRLTAVDDDNTLRGALNEARDLLLHVGDVDRAATFEAYRDTADGIMSIDVMNLIEGVIQELNKLFDPMEGLDDLDDTPDPLTNEDPPIWKIVRLGTEVIRSGVRRDELPELIKNGVVEETDELVAMDGSVRSQIGELDDMRSYFTQAHARVNLPTMPPFNLGEAMVEVEWEEDEEDSGSEDPSPAYDPSAATEPAPPVRDIGRPMPIQMPTTNQGSAPVERPIRWINERAVLGVLAVMLGLFGISWVATFLSLQKADFEKNATLPVAPDEVCDGKDNDFDGEVDEGLLVETYLDWDGDGWASNIPTGMMCPGIPWTSTVTGDCDDQNDLIHPLAYELWDGHDHNCDGWTPPRLLDAEEVAAVNGRLVDVVPEKRLLCDVLTDDIAAIDLGEETGLVTLFGVAPNASGDCVLVRRPRQLVSRDCVEGLATDEMRDPADTCPAVSRFL